eukprot:623078-Alexandrium_andersonii.AAC.1
MATPALAPDSCSCLWGQVGPGACAARRRGLQGVSLARDSMASWVCHATPCGRLERMGRLAFTGEACSGSILRPIGSPINVHIVCPAPST